MAGRYFHIESALNGFVIDLARSDASPGNKCVTWSNKGNDNQLWFYDVINHTIRSKVDGDYCLDIDDDNSLVVNEFDPDAPNQRWMFYKNRILNLENGKVLDIAQGDEDKGARICMWDWEEEDHQTFSINYVEPREFLIKSKLHGKCLDVEKKGTDPGSKVILFDEHGKDNQVWYEGRDGTIHTKMNGFIIASEDNVFQLQPYDGSKTEHGWIRLGSKIVNRFEPEKVADIKRADEDNGAEVGGWDDKGHDHQRWEYEWL